MHLRHTNNCCSSFYAMDIQFGFICHHHPLPTHSYITHPRRHFWFVRRIFATHMCIMLPHTHAYERSIFIIYDRRDECVIRCLYTAQRSPPPIRPTDRACKSFAFDFNICWMRHMFYWVMHAAHVVCGTLYKYIYSLDIGQRLSKSHVAWRTFFVRL